MLLQPGFRDVVVEAIGGIGEPGHLEEPTPIGEGDFHQPAAGIQFRAKHALDVLGELALAVLLAVEVASNGQAVDLIDNLVDCHEAFPFPPVMPIGQLCFTLRGSRKS